MVYLKIFRISISYLWTFSISYFFHTYNIIKNIDKKNIFALLHNLLNQNVIQSTLHVVIIVVKKKYLNVSL